MVTAAVAMIYGIMDFISEIGYSTVSMMIAIGRSAVTDKYLIATMLFANSTQIMINAANVLGNKEDVKYYTSLLFKIRNAFRREYGHCLPTA